MVEPDFYTGETDENVEEKFKKAIAIDQAIAKAKGNPICGFDEDTMRPYLEYPDGHKEYYPVIRRQCIG